MDKIEDKLKWIGNRTDNYLKLLMNIIYTSTKDDDKREKAEFLLKTALRVAFFLDFYSETLDKSFQKEGNKYKEILYKNVKEKDKEELEVIEKRIMNLFDYEKEIWKKVLDGLSISNKEIEQYWKMKSADSLFYGRITKIFTKDKDFIIPIYIYTRILDIVLDIKEYESDVKDKLPNILYMKLSQRIPIEKILFNKKEAIKQAKKLKIDLELKEIIYKMVEEVSSFDFNDYEFLIERIKQKSEEFNKEFI